MKASNQLLGILIFFIAMQTFALSGQVNKNGKIVVVIDPGHGGIDSGAIGPKGIQEKKVVLKISQEILRLNKTIFKDQFEIYLTRYTDTLISLRQRALLANFLNANLFISIHCNQAKNKDGKGVEVFVSDPHKTFQHKNIEESIWLATGILKEFKDGLGFISRNVKSDSFQVLREATPICPAVLLEVGFISNIDEGNYFNQEGNIKAAALAVLVSIHKYLKLLNML